MIFLLLEERQCERFNLYKLDEQDISNNKENTSRVRKSFIIMSILGPLLIATFYGVIIWASIIDGEQKEIAVLDESGLLIMYLIKKQNSSIL